MAEWWYNHKTGEVEEGPQSLGSERDGPFASREEAARAPEIARSGRGRGPLRTSAIADATSPCSALGGRLVAVSVIRPCESGPRLRRARAVGTVRYFGSRTQVGT